eukprot:s290_g22.t1
MEDLELIIERACSESPPSFPSVKEIIDRYKKMKAAGEPPKDDPNDNRLYEPLRARTGEYVIGRLEVIDVKSVEFVADMWSETTPFTSRDWVPKKAKDTPSWVNELSKRVNAILRDSVGVRWDKMNREGLACDEGELKEARKSEDESAKKFCSSIDWKAAKLHIGKDEDEVWVCPCAIRAAMAHSKHDDGVKIEEWRLSYKINPVVAGLLKGGFHRTKLDVLHRIVNEGLWPGGGGGRTSTMFAPYAPWDRRSWDVVKFKYAPPISVYIYLSGDRLCKFDARLSADGHILVHQVIPFTCFDAIWYEDEHERHHRLLAKDGDIQIVLSVDGAHSIATVSKFNNVISLVLMQNQDVNTEEYNKLKEIERSRREGTQLFPGHPTWSEAVSLMALLYKPKNADCRLCPACLIVLDMIWQVDQK